MKQQREERALNYIALVSSFFLASGSAALAQSAPDNWYVSASGGGNFLQESSSLITGFGAVFADPDPTEHVGGSLGYAGSVALGRKFDGGFRVELEGSLRSNEADTDFTRSSIPINFVPLSSGTVKTFGITLNALYDIGVEQNWPAYITLGAGAGYAWHDYDNVGSTVDVAPNENWHFEDRSSGFAAQAIAGLTVPVSSVPGLSLTADYKLFYSRVGKMSGFVTDGGTPRPISIDADNLDHSVMFGFRYAFGN